MVATESRMITVGVPPNKALQRTRVNVAFFVQAARFSRVARSSRPRGARLSLAVRPLFSTSTRWHSKHILSTGSRTFHQPLCPVAIAEWLFTTMNPITEANLKAHLVTWYQQNYFIPLLPLLEYPFTQAQTIVREAYQHAGLLCDDGATFRFDQLIMVALQSDVSNYWAERAIDWLVDDFQLTATIAQGVEAVIAEKRVAQQVRHRAGKLIRSWRALHANGEV